MKFKVVMRHIDIIWKDRMDVRVSERSKENERKSKKRKYKTSCTSNMQNTSVNLLATMGHSQKVSYVRLIFSDQQRLCFKRK